MNEANRGMADKDWLVALDRYADLLVQVGLQVRPGQTVVIDAPITLAPLVRSVARCAYDIGAADILVDWSDDPLTRIKFERAPEAGIGRYPAWKAAGLKEEAEKDAAFLYLHSPNPGLLDGIDPQRVAADQKGRATIRKPFLDMTRENKVSWTIAAGATPEWAARVFPGVPEGEAVNRLWSLIWQATRVDQDDPVGAWRTHLERLKQRLDRLNAKRYRQLVYRSADTELTIGLPEGHLWVAGANRNAAGTPFVANMPTEEVFTSPDKNRVDGVVRSTKPLNYGGRLIEGIRMRFERGQVVEASAESGNEVLQQLLATDEGARRLGEVALVPYDSPISNMNVVFYNTLFDENASCHLAIGNAFPFCLANGAELSPEEREAAGLNHSLTHVDFMIGSSDLDIDGIRADGDSEPIFRGGNWAD